MSLLCLTEVLLPPLQLLDRHTRLHINLPSSPYSHGAIYTRINEAVEQEIERSNEVATQSSHASVNPSGSAILLLKGDLQFRLGGLLEQIASPPWSWTYENMCGSPFLYHARDLHCLESTARPALHPQCSSTTAPHIIYPTSWTQAEC